MAYNERSHSSKREYLSDKAPKDRPVWNDEYQAYVAHNGRIWIQDGSTELHKRLFIIAHAWAAGHRETRTTVQSSKLFLNGQV